MNETIFEGYDADSSPYVWKNVYKKIYTSDSWNFWDVFDVGNLKTYGKPPRQIAVNTYSDKDEYKDFNKYVGRIEIGGDTDFNFKDEKYNFYLNLLEQCSTFTKEKREEYIEQLKNCRKRHHSIENFSLLLKNGGLNNFKGSLQRLDRIDKFTYELDDYFNHRDNMEHKIFSRVYSTYKDKEKQEKAKAELKDILRIYLNLFSDIYDYCNKIYKIDKELVKGMKKLGAKNITDGNDVVEYMCLAEKFWKQKKEALES